MTTRLLINAFNAPCEIRRKDFKKCLDKNLENEFIDEVVVFISDNDRLDVLPIHHKVRTVKVQPGHRPTYREFIDHANSIITSTEDLTIIANTDCYFDGSLGELRNFDLRFHCVALSRWEEKPDGSIALECPVNSQDAWIFQGRIRPIVNIDFSLGIYGCDNRFAWQSTRAGYVNINPCHSVIMRHVHFSEYRNNGSTIGGPKETVMQVNLETCNLLPRNTLKTGIFSFSLFGDQEKYLYGAKMNAILVKHVFPGFWCRFYVDDSIPEKLIEELADLGSEIVRKPRMINLGGMFWRFESLDFAGVDAMCVRDVDSRLCLRDYWATREFLEHPEALYHTFHDHPYHQRHLNGGYFSAKKPITGIREMIHKYPHSGAYGHDENFLRDIIWPKVKEDLMVHSTFGTGHEGKYGGSFIHPAFTQYRFCVERVYPDEHVGHVDHNVFAYQPENSTYH